ncbi:putative nucleotidyltransferase substrate binding domain-containing protein [Thalassotalea euphylliae]|uniref:putative nucleotidyltransferase substrate binding domain-containing protein n=1 Tax=Thalassotalea euphylliae TaxID=1655234 RepID=UPI00363C2980
MDNELSELYAFIGSIAPFEQLPESVIIQIVKQITICYVPQNQPLPPPNIESPSFYIVRKGALTYRNQQQELLGKYGEGDICTIFCYPEKYQDIEVSSEEDCLLYALDKQKLLGCLIESPAIISFFEQSAEERLKHTVSDLHQAAVVQASLTNTPIEQLYQTPAATILSSQSIQQTAIKMTELGFSCLVVVDNDEHVVGIVTDKDFRRRCIASGMDINKPVAEIMTPNIQMLDIRHTAFDALIAMTSRHIHHLPITAEGQLAGMVTITDLMHFEEQNAVNMTSLIHKASSVDELVDISKLIPQLQQKLAKLGTPAEHVGKAISAITMALTIKLIELAESLYGKAPVPFAWVAAGSQARQEQLAHSDQDNALIIDNAMQPEHTAWFERLATFVSNGLHQCGFIYCPGDVMATNENWRQTEAQWHKYFKQWINTPKPQALMNASIFFDLALVYGDASLLHRVQKQMLQQTQNASLFIAHLSKNALQHKPPLGFFRDFVLISEGEHKKTMDLKHNGIAPIVDLARIYALQEGVTAVNTIERLEKVAGSRSLTKSSAANLIDAFQFLTSLRLHHQARLVEKQKKANNYLAPKEISRLEREHLKDAFKVIKTLQDNRQAVY